MKAQGSRSAALAALALGIASAASAEVRIRLVEVGRDAVVLDDTSPHARFRIEASEPFRGSLEAELYLREDDRAERREAVRGPRARLALALETADEREAVLRFPAALPPEYAREGAIRWTLRDARNGTLAEGSAEVRLAGRFHTRREDRWLVYAAGASRPRERDPSRAHTDPQAYQGLHGVTIAERDLRVLPGPARQALEDSVALGLTLVVTEADATAPSTGALVWSDAAGAELREHDHGRGRIRRTTLAWDAPAEYQRVRDLLDDPVLPRPLAEPALPSRREVDWDAPRVHAARTRLAWVGGAALGLGLLLLELGRRIGRRQHPKGARFAALLLAGAALAPWLLYAVAAAARAGNLELAARSVWHLGPLAIEDVSSAHGGGGGARDPVLRLALPARAQALMNRLTDHLSLERIRLELREGPDAELELVPLAGGGSDTRGLVLGLSRIALKAPVLETRLAYRERDGALVGSLTALADLRHVVLVDARQSLLLGDLARGASIEVTGFGVAQETLGAAEEGMLDLLSLGSYEVRAHGEDWPRRSPALLAVGIAGAGPEPSGILRDGRELEIVTVHAQAIVPAGAPPRRTLVLPADVASDGTLVAYVPELLVPELAREARAWSWRRGPSAPRPLPTDRIQFDAAPERGFRRVRIDERLPWSEGPFTVEVGLVPLGRGGRE